MRDVSATASAAKHAHELQLAGHPGGGPFRPFCPHGQKALRADSRRDGPASITPTRFHIPVYYNISAYDKIQKEAPYHALTNAGHISYVELDGDTANNLEAFESIVRCMHDCGHRLRQHQPPGGPRPRLRVCGRHRGGMSPLRPPRGRGRFSRTHQGAAQAVSRHLYLLRLRMISSAPKQ